MSEPVELSIALLNQGQWGPLREGRVEPHGITLKPVDVNPPPMIYRRMVRGLEFDVLQFLVARPSVVFTREQLLAEVWGYRDGSGVRTVDSHIQALRRKLGAEVIRTVHGVGYALDAGDRVG